MMRNSKVHSREESYQCELCSQRFSRNDQLEKHMDSEHAFESFDPIIE